MCRMQMCHYALASWGRCVVKVQNSWYGVGHWFQIDYAESQPNRLHSHFHWYSRYPWVVYIIIYLWLKYLCSPNTMVCGIWARGVWIHALQMDIVLGHLWVAQFVHTLGTNTRPPPTPSVLGGAVSLRGGIWAKGIWMYESPLGTLPPVFHPPTARMLQPLHAYSQFFEDRV